MPDPEFDGSPGYCPECMGKLEAMRCEPDRSEIYLTHIKMCQDCKRCFPYYGARTMRKYRDPD